MIYKLKKGLVIDWIKETENGDTISKTMVIFRVPKNEDGKIILIDNVTKEKISVTRDELKNCKRHKDIKPKKSSALDIAIQILEDKNRPIHINELVDLIFDYGYAIPRGGKTFKNTISTSLNNECNKKNAKIKKVFAGVYAHINCSKKYITKKSKKI